MTTIKQIVLQDWLSYYLITSHNLFVFLYTYSSAVTLCYKLLETETILPSNLSLESHPQCSPGPWLRCPVVTKHKLLLLNNRDCSSVLLSPTQTKEQQSLPRAGLQACCTSLGSDEYIQSIAHYSTCESDFPEVSCNSCLQPAYQIAYDLNKMFAKISLDCKGEHRLN